MPRSVASLSSRTRRNGSSSSLARCGAAKSSALISGALLKAHKVPAQGGTHRSTSRSAEKWVPAFAGTNIVCRNSPQICATLVHHGGFADAVTAEIDDRLVEAFQRAVMADADDRRVPLRF